MEEQLVKDVEFVEEATEETTDKVKEIQDHIHELIVSRTNEIATKHLNCLDEILSHKDIDKISSENNLNIIGLINALANKLTIILGEEEFKAKEEEVVKVTEFIEEVSTTSEKHPIDTCFKLIKVLSDILLQLTIVEEVNKELHI